MILAAEGIRLHLPSKVEIPSSGRISWFYITIPREIRKTKKTSRAQLARSTSKDQNVGQGNEGFYYQYFIAEIRVIKIFV
jgi:hypothetical protein